MKRQIDTIKVDGLEHLELKVVQTPEGDHVVMTKDNKIVGRQVCNAGYFWYDGEKRERQTMFRATFLISKP